VVASPLNAALAPRMVSVGGKGIPSKGLQLQATTLADSSDSPGRARVEPGLGGGESLTKALLRTMRTEDDPPDRARVEHGLGGGERLTNDHHQGGLGVQPVQRLGDIHRVHVGKEAQLPAAERESKTIFPQGEKILRRNNFAGGFLRRSRLPTERKREREKKRTQGFGQKVQLPAAGLGGKG
jgi:hypothetical protein